MNKAAILTAITAAFRKEFQTGIDSAKPSYQTIAMTVPSTTAINTYGWLGKFPKMREWVGERQIEKMATEAMSIANKKYEATVGVERTDIEDDQVGMYRPMMQAKRWWIFSALITTAKSWSTGTIKKLCRPAQSW